MTTILVCICLVLLILYVVPFLVYGLASAKMDLKPPQGASPARFLASIFVSKIGTAIAFVLLFYLARETFSSQWLLYALIWWLMFIIGEVGQAIGPNYSWKEALAGGISETINLPLCAYLTHWLLA